MLDCRGKSSKGGKITQMVTPKNDQTEEHELESHNSLPKSMKSIHSGSHRCGANILMIPEDYSKTLAIPQNVEIQENSAEKRIGSTSSEEENNSLTGSYIESGNEISTKRLLNKFVKNNTGRPGENKISEQKKHLLKLEFKKTNSESPNQSPTKSHSKRVIRHITSNRQSEDGLGIIAEESTIVNTPNFVLNQTKGKLQLYKSGSDFAFHKMAKSKLESSPQKSTPELGAYL
jgi:hypothetical protein